MSLVSIVTKTTPFLTQNAKHPYFSKSFKLGHVTYQNIQLEPRVPDFHLGLKMNLVSITTKKTPFLTQNA
jgi:hypothetical protein